MKAGVAPSLMPTAWDSFPSSLETKVSRIRDWLRVCESSHPQCGSKWQCQLPRRLVDLGVDNFGAFKLVSTASLSSNEIKYTALSYCWGALRSLKTTKETVAAYHTEIPYSELPKTYLDAALITKGVGLQYTWIDALCIIQDDRDDWAMEASKMSDIYHGSTFSVTANDSRSSSGGVFTQGSSSLPERITYARAFLRSTYPKNGKSTLIHVVPKRKFCSALNERGWTLQESVLSPRIVGVINSELRWSCGLSTFWESGIEYVQGDTTDGNPPIFRAGLAEKRNRIWWRWMENYSSRRLTFPEDRLPAMLGLINYYQRIMQDVPVLGLWESSLHEDLAWMRSTNRSERLPDRLPDHNLPSWSPLSCDQAVKFEFWYGDDKCNEPAESCVDVIEHEVLWEGTPYLSRVQSSSLVVDGSLQGIYLSEATEVVGCNPPYFNLDEEVDVNDPLPWRCAVQWDVEEYRPPQTWPCLILQKKLTKGYEFGAKRSLSWRLLEHKHTVVSELDHSGAGALPMDWRSKSGNLI
jgi:Heterokaryon incompatibility protein (HET)